MENNKKPSSNDVTVADLAEKYRTLGQEKFEAMQALAIRLVMIRRFNDFGLLPLKNIDKGLM